MDKINYIIKIDNLNIKLWRDVNLKYFSLSLAYFEYHIRKH